MDTRPQRLPMGCHRGRGVWALMAVAMLAGAGLLLQACSDNKGPVGPRNPSSTTGFANTSADILIRVTANPASIEPGRRVTITVLVTNGASALGGGSGQPLAGKRVTVNTSTNTAAFGTIDNPVGITDANGIYQTTMIVRCSDAGVTNTGSEGSAAASVTVDAFVDGASSAATGTSATVTVTGTSDNAPCPGSA